MKQYNAIKVKYPDALLLFRVGDFYETFGSDAVKAANILDIILTKRGAGSESETELAGFPHHSLPSHPTLNATPNLFRPSSFQLMGPRCSAPQTKTAGRGRRTSRIAALLWS